MRYNGSNCTYMEYKVKTTGKDTAEMQDVQIVPIWNIKLRDATDKPARFSSNCTYMEYKGNQQRQQGNTS